MHLSLQRFLPALLLTVSSGIGTAVAAELDTVPEMLADLDTGTDRHVFSGTLGVLVVNTGRFIGSDERITAPFPLVYFNYNDRLYWSIASVGGWLWRSDDRAFRFGLLAKARGGVDGSDTPYTGIFDREPGIDAGLNLAWRTRYVTVGASWLADVADRSHGQSANLRLSFPQRLNQRWTLTPGVGAEWLDNKTVNYYYGVTATETSGGAPLYTGTSSLQWRAGLSVGYRLARDWRLTSGVSYTRLGEGLRDSPLVTQDDNFLVYLGFSWSFRTNSE